MYMHDNIIHIIHLKITCSHVHMYTKTQLKRKAIHSMDPFLYLPTNDEILAMKCTLLNN